MEFLLCERELCRDRCDDKGVENDRWPLAFEESTRDDRG
jgi:hypothetical protein